MRYWINLFTVDTWNRAGADGRTALWFSQRNRKLFREISKGDRCLVYVTKVGFVGLAEVVNEPLVVGDSPYGEAFDVMVECRYLARLALDTAMRTTDVENHKATHRNDRFLSWLLQQSGTEWEPEAGAHLAQALSNWSTNPTSRTLSSTQLTHRPSTGAAADLGLPPAARDWITHLDEVFGSGERVAAVELVRRIAAQGLRGTGADTDVEELLAAVIALPRCGYVVDGRSVTRSGRKADATVDSAEETADELGLLAAQEALRAHRAAVKTALIAMLSVMKPDAFEHLVSRLLEHLGVEDAIVTGRTNDGGVDVRGVLRSAEVITRPIVVQVKRYQKNVSPQHIRELRGSLSHDRGEIGLFVTLSNFTKSAREEASSDRTPVSLMNGDELANALIKFELGVKKEGAAFLRLVGFDEDPAPSDTM